ncbi:Protein kinase-like domain [Mycena kentingensis (nom. inval.)]|nr:Protein kinase-like domain [Mycena kentingensis (nom. inval.)]
MPSPVPASILLSFRRNQGDSFIPRNVRIAASAVLSEQLSGMAGYDFDINTWVLILNRANWCGHNWDVIDDALGESKVKEFKNKPKQKELHFVLPFAWKWQRYEEIVGRPVSKYLALEHHCTPGHDSDEPHLGVIVFQSMNEPLQYQNPFQLQLVELMAATEPPNDLAQLEVSSGEFQSKWYGVANPTEHPSAPKPVTLPLMFRSAAAFQLYQELAAIRTYDEAKLVDHLLKDPDCTPAFLRTAEQAAHEITVQIRGSVSHEVSESECTGLIAGQLQYIFRRTAVLHQVVTTKKVSDTTIHSNPPSVSSTSTGSSRQASPATDASDASSSQTQFIARAGMITFTNSVPTSNMEFKAFAGDGCPRFQSLISGAIVIAKHAQDNTTRFLIIHAVRGSEWTVGIQARDNSALNTHPTRPCFIGDFMFTFSLLPMHSHNRRDRFHNLRLVAYFKAIGRAQERVGQQYEEDGETADVLASNLMKLIEACIVKKQAVGEQVVGGTLRCLGTVEDQPLLLIFQWGQRGYIVKFVRGRYGEDCHVKMADAGFAPQLYGVFPLEDGWQMVVMDYLDGAYADGPTAMHAEKLRAFKAKLNELKIVHGDVRGPNIILLGDDDLKVVDWDWAGIDGVDCYPFAQLTPDESRPADVLGGEKMQHKHDAHRIEWLVEKWQRLASKRKASAEGGIETKKFK